MAFEPSPLEFHRSDVDKLVKYKERTDALPDWIVTAARYGASQLIKSRWSFSGVGPDPSSSSKEQGTLNFDSTNLSASQDDRDKLLRQLWNAGQCISIDVWCNQSNQQHTLTVQLIP